MLVPPFEVVGCSWPRPVEERDGRWVSEPEWDAPGMPYRPEPRLVPVGGEDCWLIDWREFLSRGEAVLEGSIGSEFRGYHLVMRVRMRGGGRLSFYDDDGCIIRRDGIIVHEDRAAHGLMRHEIEVYDGEVLEVAHWQEGGVWLWAGFLNSRPHSLGLAAETLLPYLPRIRARLASPEGPPLKVYTNAAAPARAILAVYSLILNGYAPSGVHLFGSDQWSEEATRLLLATLPFAKIVPPGEVDRWLVAAGGERIAGWAHEQWIVMQVACLLFTPPFAFCQLDDDVVVLGRLDEALAAFATHDLVYTQDFDRTEEYAATWSDVIPGCPDPLPTGTLNAGFFWARNRHDPRRLAEWLLRVESSSVPGNWHWGQGFVAGTFAGGTTFPLPPQRYLLPARDGLPGGRTRYDYAVNPCGYAAIHFAGNWGKPTDREALLMVPEVLGDPESGGFSPVSKAEL